MKKTEIKLIILEILSIFILILNIVYMKISNYYYLLIFLLCLLYISLSISSFEKEKVLDKKCIIRNMMIYTISYLIIMYGIGIFTGYVKTSYSLNPISIIKNIFPVIVLIIVQEIFRYHICKKGEKRKIIIAFSILLFILVDISLSIHLYNFADKSKIIELITLTMFPSIFRNTMLSFFVYKYGYTVCIIYQLITNVYLYTMPIFPNLSIYLESILAILLPIFVGSLIYLRFKKNTIKDIRDTSVVVKVATGIILFVTVIVIALYSNLFPYTIAVIGSGSMNPTLKIGDMILIDKTYREKKDRLKEGQVLVFKMKDTIYTHRIVKINKENGKYYILTKGDRKGQNIDTWVVTNKDIVGVTKLKIPMVGYPSVWLRKLVEV
ncbi:MAG: signal peptidase I [Bacilli bacterium]|nr:signal peptidase I [Bacilli bacterium]